MEQESRERKEGGVRGLNGYFWEERTFVYENPNTHCTTSQPYYYFPLCGQLSLAELPVVSGSLLSEEMGLGKTVEVLSLLLAAPAPQEVIEFEALTIQRLQEAQLAKMAAKEEKAVAVKRKREDDKDDDFDRDTAMPSKRNVVQSGGGGKLSRVERLEARRGKKELEDDENRYIDLDAYLHQAVAPVTKGGEKPSKAAAMAFTPKCKATLIIVPVSLLIQWTNELASKAPSLNVLVMHGDKKNSIKVSSLCFTRISLTLHFSLYLFQLFHCHCNLSLAYRHSLRRCCADHFRDSSEPQTKCQHDWQRCSPKSTLVANRCR